MIIALLCLSIVSVDSFPTTFPRQQYQHIPLHRNRPVLAYDHNCKGYGCQKNKVALYANGRDDNSSMSRRDTFDVSLATIASLLLTSLQSPCALAEEPEDIQELPKTPATLKDGERLLFTTKSGLKYIDLKEGNGPSPKYGQFCTFSYKGYIKVASGSEKKSEPEMFEKDKSFLTKHGNGRLVPGLDEGLHTMRVGGIRRIIIPPKLGYVTNGLGPIPGGFIERYKLNKLLEDMVAKRGGSLIFEVELLSVIDDEADQGYYEDTSMSPEDFNTLRMNLQNSSTKARQSSSVSSGDVL
eukprot:CAMPEP_0172497380 /NCGR_PEP_ID=MMETSP1066-20121228/99133_1 /TAXON_ID=671091 /ORGANISM="Coscinodiscus wailesii, Strain CCMP2513" /LENGTH=296 /DNA_ID=CAMNT_0013270117 /DNA_START=173 /DNA_END=1063 /DNA_ORIENTATION=+